MEAPGNGSIYVPTLGAVPPGWNSFPADMTWHAGLRVPHYWNYSFQVGPGPATLSIDGTTVVTAPAGQESAPATVSLARGDHYVVLDWDCRRPGEFNKGQVVRSQFTIFYLVRATDSQFTE